MSDIQEKQFERNQLVFDQAMPIIQLVNEIINNACSVEASDIHIDPYEDDVIVRFRIDGVLQQICILPKNIYGEFVARIKIISGLKTDERFLPQDGRFNFDKEVDIRVSIAASYYGESIVLRLLRRIQKAFSLEDLGFSTAHVQSITQTLKAKHGLILVTGPTGSGKTTTLYTLLTMLRETSVSIVTIEDPIEYAIKGVRQIQAREHRGLHFANGLRSILRQDPDIIMIGEIRDQETATIAVNAALTGHLVLSTLHTNSAVASIVRLLEMKIEPYLLAATLKLVISQRLIRTLCINCKTIIADLRSLSTNSNVQSSWLGSGCKNCFGTGFKGRSSIAEVLKSGAIIQKGISNRYSLADLEELARIHGLIPMTEHGLEKCLSGQTSIDEIVRATYD